MVVDRAAKTIIPAQAGTKATNSWNRNKTKGTCGDGVQILLDNNDNNKTSTAAHQAATTKLMEYSIGKVAKLSRKQTCNYKHRQTQRQFSNNNKKRRNDKARKANKLATRNPYNRKRI